MASNLSYALATSAGLLLAACTKYPPDCEPHQVFNPTARSCAVRCGTREAPAHPQCYDVDSGMLVSTMGDAATDAPVTDGSPQSDGAPALDASDAATVDGGGITAPRQVFPMSLVVLSGQQPTLKWSLAEGTDGAAIELCRDRAMSTDCQRWTATGSESRVPAPLARGVWFWRLAGRSGAREGASKSHTWSFWSSGRPSARDASYAQIPDINGDGLADVVFVEQDRREPPSDDGGVPDGGAWIAPRFAIHYGQRGGVSSAAEYVRPTGAWPSMFGYGFVADIDGDGFGDVVADAMPAGQFNIERVRVLVLRGSASGLSSSPQWIESPDAQFSGFGFLQFPVGDTDGDGRLEVALCSPGDIRSTAVPGRGRCHLFVGSSSGLGARPVTTILAPMFARAPTFAFALRPSASSQGDINGDGLADLNVASDEFAERSEDRVEGRSFIYLGARTGLTVAPTQTLIAPAVATWGHDQSLLGDQDGDGDLELLVSSLEIPSPKLFLFEGTAEGIRSPAGAMYTATSSESNITWRAIGDVTGDGLNDASISWARDVGAESVALTAILRGTSTGLDAARVDFPAETGARSFIGLPLNSVGDLDGDQVFDVHDPRDHRLCFGNASAVPNRCTAVRSTEPSLQRRLLRPMF
jgi:hypothetical protein